MNRIGRRGERRAARWLRRRGYRVLARNLQLASDEADLVMLDPDGSTVVIVEVKTRAGVGPSPALDITWAKRQRLRRLALRLSLERGMAGRAIRIDAVTVDWRRRWRAEVEHFVSVVEG